MPSQPQVVTAVTGPRRVTLGLICLWTLLVGTSVVGKRPNACMVPLDAASGTACYGLCPPQSPDSYAWLPSAEGAAKSGRAERTIGSAQPATGGPIPTPQTPFEPLGSQIDQRLGQGLITP